MLTPVSICRLILSCSAGAFFLLVFAIFRGKIQVFRTRLVGPHQQDGMYSSISSILWPVDWDVLVLPRPTPCLLSCTLPILRLPLQDLPSVWQAPPHLPVGGFNHLW